MRKDREFSERQLQQIDRIVQGRLAEHRPVVVGPSPSLNPFAVIGWTLRKAGIL